MNWKKTSVIQISHPNTSNMKKKGLRNIEAYKKISSKKSRTDGFIILLMGYARYTTRDLESCLSIVVGLDEDGLPLTLKQKNSNSVTYVYLQELTLVEIFQKLFTPWVIMKEPCKLIMMTLG